MQVTLANPRGFCAGVDRAIEIVDRALEVLGAPIYVRHEVVHNRFVVNNLRDKGAVFVQELDEVPDHATVIFSAHGVSRAVQEQAKQRGLKVFDATCPLVTKVHVEVTRYSREGRETVLIGHKNHPEVEGTMGQYETRFGGQIYRVDSPEEVAALVVNHPEKLAFVTQTTLSVDDAALVIDALRAKFPAIVGPRKDDICYATTNRQSAVKEIAPLVDVTLVIGSANSSNSNRLVEVAKVYGCQKSYLINDWRDIPWPELNGVGCVGLTAGASAPDVLIQGVIRALHQTFNVVVEEVAITKEDVVFNIPRLLRDAEEKRSVNAE